MRWAGWHATASARDRLLLALVSCAVYAGLYMLLEPWMGLGTAALGFAPVVAGGLLLGSRGGFAFGIFVTLVNHGLTASRGHIGIWPSGSIVFYGVILGCSGAAFGWLQETRVRLRDAHLREAVARREAEETNAKLLRSEARWRSIVENAPQDIALLDAQGRITPVACLGGDGSATATAPLGRVPPHERERLRTIVGRVLRDGENVQFEMQAHSEDGALRPYLASAGPIRVGGRVEGGILFVSDISEKKRVDEAMRRAEKHATVGSLSAGIAHEINNPLTLLRLRTDLFLSDLQALPPGPLPETWRQTAESFGRTSQNATDRIKLIVQSLRTLAKPTRPDSEAHVTPLLEATMTLAHGPLSGLTVELEAAPDVRAGAPSDQVGQVVLNLVLNAAQACPPSGGRIAVRAWTENERTYVSVTDNGCGVPDHVRPHLFAPFFTTKPNGTGLGLPICKHLAESNGGALTFADAEGGGSVFTLELPARLPRQAGSGQRAPGPEDEAQGAAPTANP